MATPEFNFLKEVLPVVEEYAARKFAHDGDQEAKVMDAVSVAWEMHEDKPWVQPRKLAQFACKRVKVGRQFQELVRSVTGPDQPNQPGRPKPRKRKPKRLTMDLRDLFRLGDNPADIAALNLDFVAWWGQVPTRYTPFALAFMEGDTTKEVANRFGLSFARISQIRRLLVDNWHVYTA